jgi:hypothetical protein
VFGGECPFDDGRLIEFGDAIADDLGAVVAADQRMVAAPRDVG